MEEKQSNFSFVDTTATGKVFDLTKRIRAVAGGTSASKTISILMWLIDYSQNKERSNKLSTVTSESYPHLAKGALLDFQNIMKDRHYWHDDLWHDTKHIYTFETGNKLEFSPFDTYSKAHGSRRDVLFVNEGNNMSYDIVDQLMVRTRETVWLDWNPTSEFWFYTDLLGKRNDIDFITLTYKDNEALDETTIREIESHKNNKNWWKVYGLGQLGEIEARIYTGWQLIDSIPHEARLERRGLDFGYSNDPSALVDIYYYNGGYILDEQLYQKGLTNKQLADVINNLATTLTIADSAEPKSIDEIKSYGVSIIPCVKGRDSVKQGIQYVQNQRISVTKRSINLIKEYRNYLWETDKDGKIINEPIGIFNHCFVGNTEVRTADGYKQIKDIKKGDWVITSKGIKPVLKRWNNGIKQVNKYLLQFDTFNVTLEATSDHLIKTTKGWKKISKLQSGMEIYHNNYLGVKSTTSTQKRSIFHEDQDECTQKSGNSIMGQFLKDFMYTTRIKIRGIIDYLTSNFLRTMNTYPFMQEKDLIDSPIGLKTFTRRVCKRLRNGMEVRVEDYGIASMAREHGLIDNTQRLYAYNVGINTKHAIVVYPNIAIQTAKLKLLDVEEGKKEKVYDLEVQGCHEYFANTILVHNCLDAVRYGFDGLRGKQEAYVAPKNDITRQNWSLE